MSRLSLGAGGVVLALVFFLLGVQFQTVSKDAEARLSSKVRYFSRWVAARRRARPQRLSLEFKSQDFLTLAMKRSSALAESVLVSSPDDFVSAVLRRQEASWKVRVRLKGDWVDHLKTDKWSFRVRLKGDEAMGGMREFSLQHPGTRNHIYEWIYHEMLRREDILTPRYDFVHVTINGRESGVYALEEHFEKTLVESRRRREGPVLKFSEDLLWAERRRLYPRFEPSPAGYVHEEISPVEAFKMRQILNDPAKREMFHKAASLLESFRLGRLPVEAVFDVGRMAVFLALNELAGAKHAVIWHNIRFYYDPVTSRLEPIGFDGDAGNILAALERPGEGFAGRLLADKGLHREYVRALERLSAPEYLDGLFTAIGEGVRARMDILQTDYPGLEYGTGVFYGNQETIRNALFPPKGVHAFFEKVAGKRIVLKAANIQNLPVDIYGLSWKGLPLFPIRKRTTLTPPSQTEGVRYLALEFDIPPAYAWKDSIVSELGLGYRIAGTERERVDSVFPWPYPEEAGLERDMVRRKPNPGDFPFISVEESGKTIRIRTGAWRIRRDMVLPAGYTVLCGAGTRLTLEGDSAILSRSPLRWTGTEAAPVIVSGGKGVAVFRAGGESFLKYVSFQGLAAPPGLTGGLTFFESAVRIENGEFVRGAAEDALNVIRSRFAIVGTLFARSQGDALDADFSEGSVSGSMFVKSGNDAVDLSGSRVVLSDTRIEGAGDKGISAGEMSDLKGEGLTISDVGVGVVSKDVSIVNLHKVHIARAQIGLAAYQKKAVFGGGFLGAREVRILETLYPTAFEPGSVIEIDGKKLRASPPHAREILESRK